MIEFKVSAPGKITLFGEHAQLIKNKTTVLAGSVDMRTTLKFSELPDSLDSQKVIKIEFPRDNLSINIPLQQVLSYFRGDDEFDSYRLSTKAESFVLFELKKNRLLEKQAMILKVVLYLLISIAQREQIDIKSFHVHVNSALPTMIGESLGNTMSSTVCLAACFLHWSRQQKNICDTAFDTDHLEKISKYATECEDFIYIDYIMPRPDANVCTYGSIIEFHPDRPINVFNDIPSMKILLVDTIKNHDSIYEKENLKRDYPEVAYSIATNIETVTESVCLALRNFSSDDTDESMHNNSVSNLHIKLGYFMNINQELLKTLDVSTESITTINTVTKQYPKLQEYTIDDCGRLAYIFLPPNTEGQVIQDVSGKLSRDLSYTVTMVNLGCVGVRIE